MTIQIYCEYPRKILKNKKQIQKDLSIKITNKAKVFFINSIPENEIKATWFFEAINLGFSVPNALTLKQEDAFFQKINIKDYTKRNNLEMIRARIIGTQGKVLATLENLTNTYISLHDNSIGIIGTEAEVTTANQAIIILIQGSKHSNVYAYLEKQLAINKQKL